MKKMQKEIKNRFVKEIKSCEIVWCMKQTFFLTVTRSVSMFPFMSMSLQKKIVFFKAVSYGFGHIY